jgi:hypothetical protein
MKHLSHRPLAILAVAFGLVMLAAPMAHAFTMDDQSNTNSDGSARYTDPGQRFSGTGNGQTTIQQGNTSFRFGGQTGSFDQRYDNSRMFEPIPRPGEDR